MRSWVATRALLKGRAKFDLSGEKDITNPSFCCWICDQAEVYERKIRRKSLLPEWTALSTASELFFSSSAIPLSAVFNQGCKLPCSLRAACIFFFFPKQSSTINATLLVQFLHLTHETMVIFTSNKPGLLAQDSQTVIYKYILQLILAWAEVT